MCSLDLSKAFDKVSWSKYWKALKAQGLPDYILPALQRIYQRQIGKIIGSNDELSIAFPFKYGVRQGCPMSPMLCNAILEETMKKWMHDITTLDFGIHTRGYNVK